MNELHDHTEKKLIAAAVIPILPTQKSMQVERETETRGLVEALGGDCAFVRTVFIRKPTPALLFGSGQLDVIAAELRAHECDLFVVDGQLSPIQQRNLEKRVECKVIDRTGLILEIFGLRARTRAGRLQVETARLAYERSRLVRTWTHLERQRGGRGFISGPGETQIEADRRLIDDALLRLKKQLSDVEKTRRLQRSGREAQDKPVVALVGYTNAGKSTLFNRLTEANVFAKNMPFATLDPTIRQVQLTSSKTISLVDTVGFITDLPTALIESFKATLEETMDADLIIHVHDASSPDADDQAEDVTGVLDEMEALFDAECPPIFDVWNKCDLLSEEQKELREYAFAHSEDPDNHLLISATTGEGIVTLLDVIADTAFDQTLSIDLSVPPAFGKMLAWLHRNAQILETISEEDTGNTRFVMSISAKNHARLIKAFPEEYRQSLITESPVRSSDPT